MQSFLRLRIFFFLLGAALEGGDWSTVGLGILPFEEDNHFFDLRHLSGTLKRLLFKNPHLHIPCAFLRPWLSSEVAPSCSREGPVSRCCSSSWEPTPFFFPQLILLFKTPLYPSALETIFYLVLLNPPHCSFPSPTLVAYFPSLVPSRTSKSTFPLLYMLGQGKALHIPPN